MRKLINTRAILIAALIGFAISIGIGLNELYRQRSTLEVQHKINAWLMAQTELEMQRLIQTLDRYVSDVDPVSHDDLVMRFDLLWSRLPVLLTGSQSQALRRVPGLDEAILGIQADLEAVEDQVLDLSPDDIATYRAVRDVLIANAGPLHDLVFAAVDFDSAQIAEERQEVRARFWQAALSLFGALGAGAIFIVLLMRETRRTRYLLAAATDAEHDARQARAQLDEAIESISEGFMLYGADRKLLIANRKLQEIYSTVGEMIVAGSDFRHLCMEAVRRGQFADFADPETAGEAALFDYDAGGEYTFRLADGRWIRVTRRVTADGGCVGVHSDITELKAREAELAAKSQQLQATLDNISQGVAVFDADHRLAMRNDRFVRLLDLPPELGADGQSLDAILRFQTQRGDVGDSAIDAAAFVHRRVELDLPSGRAIEAQSSAMPDGGVVATYTDISERRRAERERRTLMDGMHQSQKMQAIGTLAGGVAHDFNNVLASILGNAELALDDLEQSHPAYEAVQQICLAGEHAAKVVEQILAFSRHQTAEAKPIRLDKVVAESLKLLRAALPATVELIERQECDEPTIIGDATQINQVIMNLGVNASHATGAESGTITIALEAVEIDGGFAEGLAAEERDATGQPIRIVADQDQAGATLWSGLLTAGPYVKLTVHDTGCGMSYGTMSRMFEPFFTTKEVGAGTGLGLSAIHGIVMRHRGAIVVESRLGAGTTFTIFLPRAVEQVAAPAAAPEAQPDRQSQECVMVVDDEPMVLSAICRMLRRAGFLVDGMSGSQDALTAFRADPHRWHLVITDQTMPEMTGAALAEEMLRIRPDVAIVLCTGYSAVVDEQRAREMGVRAFAQKPIVGRALIDMVRRVLDTADAAQPA